MTTKFLTLCIKMAERIENLDHMLHDWAKVKYKKKALNRYEKHSLAKRRKIKPFHSSKMPQKKFSSSRQSSETNSNTKFALVSREPLLYLEFNKTNKQNVNGINSFNKFSFSRSQNNCCRTD